MSCQVKANTSHRGRTPHSEQAGAIAPRHHPAVKNALRRQRWQAKLRVSQANDHLEREADRVADQVMRSAQPPSQLSISSKPGVQRLCEECEEEMQQKAYADEYKPTAANTEEEEEELQMQGKGTDAQIEVSADAERQVNAAVNGPGQPLAEGLRQDLEGRFGHDFSGIRVHADQQAGASAQAVNARAYTLGNHVVFGHGEYQPQQAQGKHLLAHELTHTIQQGAAKAQNSANGASAAGTLNRSEKILQRLGANPNCTPAQVTKIRQAIYDARGWIDKAAPILAQDPLPAKAVRALRRHFGPVHGIPAHASMIRNRILVARRALGSIPFSCDTPGTTALCARNHCGWAVAGSNAATICTNAPSTLDLKWPFAVRCVFHESLHAAMAFMNVDVYDTDPNYPGTGTQPLKNPTSYVRLTMALT